MTCYFDKKEMELNENKKKIKRGMHIDNLIHTQKFRNAVLKNNIDKISWYTFSSNPLIFKLEYNKMSDNFSNLKEDIIKEVMHPKRVFKDPNYDYI